MDPEKPNRRTPIQQFRRNQQDKKPIFNQHQSDSDQYGFDDHQQYYHHENEQNYFNHDEQREDYNYNNYLPKKKINFMMKSSHQTQINQRVFFPYPKPYDLQLKYIKHILNCLDMRQDCLIQSPTGSGKTLCLLSSILGWVNDRNKKKTDINKIVYMSRSHSQLAQIQKQLEKTCYRPNMVVMGSRKKLCVHQPVKKIQDDHQIVGKCNQAIQNAKQVKKIQLLTPEQFEKQGYTPEYYKELRQSQCTLYQTFEIRKQKAKNIVKRLEGQAVTIQKQIDQCQIEKTCPYFYPSSAKYYSNLVVMPYNYVLTKKILARNAKIVQDSILIFDEGHNILNSACEGMSSDIKIYYFQRAISDLTTIINSVDKKFKNKAMKQLTYDAEDQVERNSKKKQEKKQKSEKKTADGIKLLADKLKQMLAGYQKNYQQFCDRQIAKNKNKIHTQSKNGGYNNYDEQIKEFIPRQNVQKILLEVFLGQQSQISFEKLLEQLFQASMMLDQIYDYVSQGTEQAYAPFSIKTLSSLLSQISYITKEQILIHYGVFIHTKDLNKQKKQKSWIKFFCFNSAFIFQKIKNMNPYSIIITSGTLAPLQNWNKNTGLDLSPLSNNKDHVIKPEQTLTLMITKHNGQRINMVTDREKVQNNVKIAFQTIKKICQNTPEGILVILPSKPWKNKFQFYHHKVKDTPAGLQKKVFFETQQNTKDIQAFMQVFEKACKGPRGAILFAVCRGSLSEGIDFHDHLCRAVVIVGVPRKPYKDPYLINSKRYHTQLHNIDKSNKINPPHPKGEQWQNDEKIRATNQGLGRAIRHSGDYGMIYLIDSFYEKQYEKYTKKLSGWALKRQRRDVDSKQIPRYCDQFFTAQRKRQ